jgi:hypothetical protein
MTKTLSDLSSKVRFRIENCGRRSIPEGFDPMSSSWTCVLYYGKRMYTVPFFMGPGCSGPPTVEQVLECLLSDASLGEEGSFDAFCGAVGYDTDSRKAEKSWRECKAVSRRMRTLLGDDFDEFMMASR